HVGTATRNVTVRNGTPATLTAAFTSPADGATVTGNVTIGMSESGANGTPITFTLSVDSTQVFTAAGTATSASYSWNSASVANGSHTLNLTVRDGAGRTATAARSVSVTNMAPPPPPPGTLKVFITSPAEGATVNGTVWSDIWVEGAAAGTNTFTLSIGGMTLASATGGNHVTLPWDSTRVTNGTHTLSLTVGDGAGRTSTATRTVTVSNGTPTPPPPATITVFITAPGEGATVSGTAWFTIWIESAAAGNKTYTLSVGGTTMATTATTSNGPVSIPWSTTGTP